MVTIEADCTSAFYQVPEEEEFYVTPPKEWLVDRERRGLSTDVVWKLRKPLPARRKAAAFWTDHVATNFATIGLSQNLAMPYFYTS